MDITKLPKIDLHCHIDGSLTQDFIKEYATMDIPEDITSMIEAPSDCDSLTKYLTCFDLPISCLQTKEGIKNAVVDIIKQVAAENIKYIELRFAPYFSLNEYLSYKDIIEAAIEGTKTGLQAYGVYSNIIVCAMRHLPEETNITMLQSCREYLNYGVCALDLAGDESAFSNELFKGLFEEANRLDMPFTIHSGECGSLNNVKLAVEYGAKRIGHGIALMQDIAYFDVIKKKHIGLELCPTSNYQTHAIEKSLVYPLRQFLDNDLLATINTDNRTVSSTEITKELTLANDSLNVQYEFAERLYKNAVEISFASDDIKHILMKL